MRVPTSGVKPGMNWLQGACSLADISMPGFIARQRVMSKNAEHSANTPLRRDTHDKIGATARHEPDFGPFMRIFVKRSKIHEGNLIFCTGQEKVDTFSKFYTPIDCV